MNLNLTWLWAVIGGLAAFFLFFGSAATPAG